MSSLPEPEPSQRHGQPPSLPGSSALVREGTKAHQLFPKRGE